MSELYTAAEAARILGVTVRTVHRMGAEGLLHKIRIQGGVRYRKNEVGQLKKERDVGFSAQNLRSEVASLRYSHNRMQSQVNFLMLKAQLNPTSYEFNDRDLLAFYESSEAPPKRVVGLARATEWVEIMLCLAEAEFKRLSALTGDPHPWRRFFDYADKLMVIIKAKRGYKNNLELRQLADHLAFAQQELRHKAIVLMSSEPTKIPAADRFETLVSVSAGEPIDPDEMIKGVKLTSKAKSKSLKRLSAQNKGSKGSPEDPHEDE